MKKQAVSFGTAIGDSAKMYATVAALAYLTMFGAAGVVAAKLTAPGKQDLNNLQKQYSLARKKNDLQTQRILAQRQQADNIIDKQKNPKAIRVFS